MPCIIFDSSTGLRHSLSSSLRGLARGHSSSASLVCAIDVFSCPQCTYAFVPQADVAEEKLQDGDGDGDVACFCSHQTSMEFCKDKERLNGSNGTDKVKPLINLALFRHPRRQLQGLATSLARSWG